MTARLLNAVCVGPCVLPRVGSRASRDGFVLRGALGVAALLAEAGLDVGLAAPTDGAVVHGALAHRAESFGVHVGPWRDARHPAHDGPRRVEREIFSMPESWQANVLVISGVDTNVTRAGALCRLARAFRRDGAAIVVDLRADMAWDHGRPPILLRSLLLECDVLRVRQEDVGVLDLTLGTFLAMLSPRAALIFSGSEPTIEVLGAETRTVPLRDREVHAVSRGDALVAATAAVCARRGALYPREERTWGRIVAELELSTER